MKKILVILVAMIFSFVSSATAGIDDDLLRSIENESPDIWGISSFGRTYIPRKGGIKVCKTENKLIVAFCRIIVKVPKLDF